MSVLVHSSFSVLHISHSHANIHPMFWMLIFYNHRRVWSLVIIWMEDCLGTLSVTVLENKSTDVLSALPGVTVALNWLPSINLKPVNKFYSTCNTRELTNADTQSKGENSLTGLYTISNCFPWALCCLLKLHVFNSTRLCYDFLELFFLSFLYCIDMYELNRSNGCRLRIQSLNTQQNKRSNGIRIFFFFSVGARNQSLSLSLSVYVCVTHRL